VLCCNTDTKNVKIDEKEDDYDDDSVSAAEVAACIKEYKHIQAYIDEYHRVSQKTLSVEVKLDVRVGRGGKGIYLCSCLIYRAAPYISPWES
jgi:hypothetical protein